MAAFDIGVRPAVRRALERLDEGSYGSCDQCLARISSERLTAVPYARRCERCQRQAEYHWHELDAMIAERVRNLAGEPQGPAWRP
jgi:RNA polymerase-binding transcription factor DksA